MNVTVVVPSYRRPAELERCLGALAAQSRRVDEVVVVRRADDDGTRAVAAAAGEPVRQVIVTRPGVLAAMREGAEAARGDAIGFVDDDASPRPDWLARLLPYLEEPQVGGAGGRDVVPTPTQTSARSAEVGVVTGWGRLVGNHHLAQGAARDVTVLKGANMLWRREALVLPVGLRGAGAEVHYEVALCLRARALGWRLVFDPDARVDHEPAARFDADQRRRPAPRAARDAAYNLVMALDVGGPRLTRRRAVYGLGVGDRAVPGVVRAGAAVAQRDADVARLAPSAVAGQLDALRALALGERLTFWRPPA